MTPSGSKRIEDIAAGDLVMARSDQFLADPMVRARPVLVTYRFEHHQTLALTVQGKAIRDTLPTTPEHPFAVKIQPGDTRHRHRADRG
ncbi:polymorphic toxin-type HINT domain-containing protein [Woodsholea maritima]|uniref:polymorphic toxin-type HINT domain-containing protein n=1 Tax=Woodsholea maritima TaxID=240237 RepID=UPI0003742651|nr:polymorphic toxin-type HINT domain-containing protein [Woodsholea maritima]